MIITNHKTLLLIGFSILAPVFLMNAYADTPENYKPKIFLISGVPFEQVDSNYKNLPIDHGKDAFVVYLDGTNLSVRDTSGSLIEDPSSENVAIEGTCLNTYDISTGSQTNDMCQQGVYMPLKYWTETQIGKFIIFQ
ncbi:Uncharacterised protein [uncultured archaeon]|nr:Uncharacterised protein [uncultured archaeon]